MASTCSTSLVSRIVDFNGQPILDDFYLAPPDIAEPHRLREAIELTRGRLEERFQ